MAHSTAARTRLRIHLFVIGILALLFLNGMWGHHKAGILKSTLHSVYEDRLMAESYLLDLTDLLHERNRMMRNCSPEIPQNTDHRDTRIPDAELGRIIASYQNTELTAEEQVCFDGFLLHIAELRDLESGYFGSTDREVWLAANANGLDRVFAATADDMDRLSRIQIAEGRTLTERSFSLVADTSMLSELQMALVLIVGLLIYAVLAESRLLPTDAARSASLN